MRDPVYRFRRATLEDGPGIEALIERSARSLGRIDYSAEQIEGALEGAFGLDTQLIRDQTYFVAETGGELAACGGWSRRRTLFGSDSASVREPEELDPHSEAARIRAFFVDPAHARQGLGRRILELCEAEARTEGFTRASLMATLIGVRLYAASGYVEVERVDHELSSGLSLPFVRMSKELAAASDR